ncbi:MAG: hypothetical protein ACOYO1_15835 [Bacteroidales bacterium]
MEVHHHPDIRRKDFKEYILEGLMIFMAVTLGFFAEKLRENLTDHAKEKELIVSLIDDTETDIINFRKTIELNKLRVLKLDTISIRCFNYGNADINDASLYNVVTACIKHPDFVSPVERTMAQLKNAGEMRLIKNIAAANNIIFYDDILKKLINQQDYYELHLKVLLDATEHLFNLKYYPLNPKTYKWDYDFKALLTAKLIDHDKVKIIEFGNKAKIFQGIVIFYLIRLEEAQQHAIRLIETLKKEYHLK